MERAHRLCARAARARRSCTPSVIRPYSHSLSDDEVMYRPPAERDADAARDPLTTFPRWLIDEGIATEADLDGSAREVGRRSRRPPPTTRSRSRSPTPTRCIFAVYSPDVDPTSEQFDTEDDPQFAGEPTTMVDLLNACMKDEMRRDPKILMFGEDVADVSREENLGKVKGKGGVFKVTWGLQKEFGGDARVQHAARRGEHRRPRDRPRGARVQAGGRDPVLRLHLAGVHAAARRARDDALAVEQRLLDAGRGAHDVRRLHPRRDLSLADGRVALHALPGLRVVCPSTALDANGLLRTAIRCDDPVIFLEHKHLYRQTYNKAAYPGPNFMIPFGKAKVVRDGAQI